MIFFKIQTSFIFKLTRSTSFKSTKGVFHGNLRHFGDIYGWGTGMAIGGVTYVTRNIYEGGCMLCYVMFYFHTTKPQKLDIVIILVEAR